jgi:hypothetical protein
MSAAGRQVWISVTAGAVATMTMLGIVGCNGAHPHPYYWAIVVTLMVSPAFSPAKSSVRQNKASRPRPWFARVTDTKGA